MRITRKIPGIRLPLPGRQDEAAPGLEIFPPGWTAALTYVFLLAILGIYQFCTLKFGGGLSLFWLETKVLGFSHYAIATGVNSLLVVFALVTFLATRREEKLRSWKRAVAFLVALGLLVCTQVYLNGWKNAAVRDCENTVAMLAEEAEMVAQIRAEIADLDEHPWGGEYVTNEGSWEKRWLLTPDRDPYQVVKRHDYSETEPLYERSWRYRAVPASVTIEEGLLTLGESWRVPDSRYAVVEWGERRYLVESDVLDEFLAREDEPEGVEGVYLRVGDEKRPLAGRPAVVQDLR